MAASAASGEPTAFDFDPFAFEQQAQGVDEIRLVVGDEDARRVGADCSHRTPG